MKTAEFIVAVLIILILFLAFASTLGERNCIHGAMTAGESVSNETLQFCFDNF